MHVETSDPDDHRILVNCERGGAVTVTEFTGPRDPRNKPGIRIRLSEVEAIELANALVDVVERWHLRQNPAHAAYLAAIEQYERR